MKCWSREMKNRTNKEYLFVDGYNIINSWEILKELKDTDFEGARDKLINILAEYKYYSKIEIVLVFDAHLVKGNNGTVVNYNGLEVVYTKERETADQYIEKKLNEMGRVKRVRVATSDWMEQQIVLGRGGTRISARELEMEIFDEKNFIRRKGSSDKEKNNLVISRLNQDIVEKLNNWLKNDDNLD